MAPRCRQPAHNRVIDAGLVPGAARRRLSGPRGRADDDLTDGQHLPVSWERGSSERLEEEFMKSTRVETGLARLAATTAVALSVAACGTGVASSAPSAASSVPSAASQSAAATEPAASSSTGASSAEPSGSATSGAAPTLGSGDPVTIRLLTAFAEGSVFNGPPDLFVETVEQNSNGRITFEVAGPEVVPFSEGLTAVGNGVYDIHYNVPLFHTGIVPEGEAIYFISGESSCQEYRDAGALDIYDEAHREKANVFFLGCGGGGAHGATFLLKEPYESLEEFRGKKFRGFGLYTRVLDVLGASSVAMPPGDIYNAIERGVVDGAAYPNLGIVEQALQEVAPYIVMPPYLPFRYGFYMNPESFEQLPEDVRTFLQETAWALEDDYDAYWVEQRDAEAEQLDELGMQEVNLPEEESERLRTIIQDELWKFIRESSPEVGPRLEEAFKAVEG
jgi:TRAP-type C4-dicarboxylate transport system substrate-binding protein